MRIEKTHLLLRPDTKKVLLRPLEPSSVNQKMNIITRVLNLTEAEVKDEAERIKTEFKSRHRDTEDFFLKRFNQVASNFPTEDDISRERKLLTGALFSMEYSLESTALFNPSIVWHPDQSGLPDGSRRFILSLRAVGEGHISSIVFRTGVIDSSNKISVEEPGRFVSYPVSKANPVYDKGLFIRKAGASGFSGEFTEKVSGNLGSTFTLNELENTLEQFLSDPQYNNKDNKSTAEELLSFTSSEYEIFYNNEIPLSERVIFPGSPAESNGVEDARFVEFREDDGSISYYATYTAYNGRRIQSQLLSTKDFLHFRINKVFGSEARNKGMALFPRKVNGKYVMLSRQDNENNYIMYSDDLLFWESKKLLSEPAFVWELVQQGNCGSPIETEKGWLVLTHGVGPVRKYCIGAMLLDINDPGKMIGRLKDPLISADEEEREGYVPNVVYTCGSIVKGDDLIIPYAVSDFAGSFAKVNLTDLLNELKSGRG
jgi:predicted GH43/DUF377 family glycosyl hydrolase